MLYEVITRLRFFGTIQDFEFSDMPKFTQIDYDREMAFIATTEVRGTPNVITSYSIHYTKLYDLSTLRTNSRCAGASSGRMGRSVTFSPLFSFTHSSRSLG